MEFESRRESGKIIQTVRKRDEASSKSAPALDCNQPFPPYVSIFEEARGFLWPMYQRGRVKTPRKDKNWYAGRVRTRTPMKEEEKTEEEEKTGGFPSRLWKCRGCKILRLAG